MARLHEVAAAFELYNGPRQISVRTIVAGPAGWVIFGSRNNRNNRLGATAWTSSTGDDFTIHDDVPALSSQPGEQILGLDVTPTGLDLGGPQAQRSQRVSGAGGCGRPAGWWAVAGPA